MVLHIAFSGRSLAAVPKGSSSSSASESRDKKGVGDKDRDKRRHVVQIPDRGKRQQRAEQVHGALQDQGIGERHRGGGQPFAAAQHVRQLIELIVHQPVCDVAQLARLAQLANFVTGQQQDPVGGHRTGEISVTLSSGSSRRRSAVGSVLRSWCFRLQLKATR